MSREHFDRALHVGLEDDVELLDLALLHALEELVERHARAWLCDRPRGAASWRGTGRSCAPASRPSTTWSESPAFGTSSKPVTCTGVDGPASLMPLAALVGHGAHAARGRAGEEGVADLQRAVLHEHRGHGAAADFLAAPRARRPARGISGLALRSSMSAVSRIMSSSSSMPCLLERRDFDGDGVAAPLLGQHAAVGELAA